MFRDVKVMDEKEIRLILQNHEERLRKMEAIISSKGIKKSPNILYDEGISNLCKAAKISMNEFHSAFFNKDGALLLIIPPEGKNENEKQLKATLCILTANDYIFNTDFIKSRELLTKLKKLGIKSLGNLSTNMTKHRQLLILEGKSGSHNFGYRITIPGKKEGIRIIKELVSKNA